MSCRLELKPSAKGAGYADLQVRDWGGEQPPTQISIQRNSDAYYLNDNGQWGTSEAWITVAARPIPAGLAIECSHTVVDRLAGSSSLRYRANLANEAYQDASVLTIDPQVVTSLAAARIQPEAAPVVEPEAKPIPEPEQVSVTPEADPEPEPTPVPAKRSSARVWLLLTLLVLLLAGAASWWFMLRAQTDTPPESTIKKDLIEQVEPTVQVPDEPAESQTGEVETPAAGEGADDSASAAAPCDIATIDAHNELTFLQSCLQSQPSDGRIRELLQQAQAARHCDLVRRLLIHQSRTKPAFAYLHGRQYDPDYHQPGGCIDKTDLETAAYWYRVSMDLDDANTALKSDLGRVLTARNASVRDFDEGITLLQSAAQAGDEQAKTLLQELQPE